MDNISHLRADRRFEYTIDSAADRRLVAELVDEADVVYHLAAAVGVELIIDSPVRAIETNVHTTEIVLAQANKKRRPVLIASSSEVYGKSAALPFRETGDLTLGGTHNGRWAYACSKAIDEFLAIAYWRERGLPTVIVRLFNTVGPRQTGRYGMVVPRFVRQALTDEPLTVYGDGTQRRCFCHVADVIDGLTAVMEREECHGEVINIGSQEEVTIHELARRVIELTGSRSDTALIPYAEAYEDGFEDMHRRVPDISKAAEVIGWHPSRSLDEIITEVAEVQRVASAA
jgi:UDP-glucose 4-epimerase